MPIHITSGTVSYLEKIAQQSPNIVILTNGEGALAYTEGEQAAVFETPRSYESVTETGIMPNQGFVAINNIPVTEEGRPIFEEMFKKRAAMIDRTPGFQALRVLRPKTGNTYLVLTAWEDEASFTNWKNSESFQHAHKKGSDSKKRPPFAAGPAYVTTYHIHEENA